MGDAGGRARPDRRALEGGARRGRHGRRHGDHQPVRPRGVQGRRLHLQRPPGAARGDRQGDALDRPRRRAGRRGLRLLGRPRGHRGRRRQGPARRARALPRGRQRARRLLREPGLRLPLRARAQAERAARRHLPAHRRARAALHHHARPARPRGPEPRGRARDDGRAVVPPRRRAGAVGRQALPHRPQRAGRRALRPGLPLRLRGPQGGVPARPAARARRLRRAAALRRARLPQREPRGRVGLRGRLHAHLHGAGREGRATSTRCPRSRRRSRRPRRPSSRWPRSTATAPTRSRPSPRRSTRWPSAATTTSGSTSYSSRFCSACAEIA